MVLGFKLSAEIFGAAKPVYDSLKEIYLSRKASAEYAKLLAVREALKKNSNFAITNFDALEDLAQSEGSAAAELLSYGLIFDRQRQQECVY